MVHVYRKQNGTTIRMEIPSTELVPGDIFEVHTGKQMVCDAILIDGVCLMDEAALTGESVPMHKTQLPSTHQYFSESDKNHILYSGTTVMTSELVDDPSKLALAMAYQTGFNTGKGLLIRAIMFNNPGQYQFEKDANKFLLYLIIISLILIGIFYIIMYTKPEKPIFADVGLPSVDIMLTMVPPGLTVTLSLGVQYAQARLGLKKVSVLKGRLINAAGRMKVCLFDKTGTLTINEVVLEQVYVNNQQQDSHRCLPMNREANQQEQEAHMRLSHNFAADHTLITMVPSQGKTVEGPIVVGDPLEVELLNFSKAKIENGVTANGKNFIKIISVGRGPRDNLGIVNVFGFKSEL